MPHLSADYIVIDDALRCILYAIKYAVTQWSQSDSDAAVIVNHQA